eukprot:TRINITY_DN12668_c0_g1_i1.p1 TRINITY_DN12668_c0_g1~~TRINITY_DN12668_c0_g1_i1.p1  ORF type:complete len:192 (-),score=36.64 TRINITY_DN12668_c0_g1_i1:30-521(-)
MVLFNHLSLLVLPVPEPEVHIAPNKVLRMDRHRYLGSDACAFTIDLDVDLRSLWNWNTKAIYLFVVAEYSTDANPSNSVVVWDRILNNAEESHFSVEDEMVEYHLLDNGSDLRGTTVKLSVRWDVTPLAGILYGTTPNIFAIAPLAQPKGHPAHSFTLPVSYV